MDIVEDILPSRIPITFLEFPFVIEEIQTFLEPVFDAIVNENEWQEQWNFIMKWNKNERSPKL